MIDLAECTYETALTLLSEIMQLGRCRLICSLSCGLREIGGRRALADRGNPTMLLTIVKQLIWFAWNCYISLYSTFVHNIATAVLNHDPYNASHTSARIVC